MINKEQYWKLLLLHLSFPLPTSAHNIGTHIIPLCSQNFANHQSHRRRNIHPQSIDAQKQVVTDVMDLLRRLAEEEEVPPPKWQLPFMSVLMILMFAALITDRIAPDHTFVIALAFCIVSGIVDMKEGLGGFANEGVLTVMVRNVNCSVPIVVCFSFLLTKRTLCRLSLFTF
jgi:hypothetical protein